MEYGIVACRTFFIRSNEIYFVLTDDERYFTAKMSFSFSQALDRGTKQIRNIHIQHKKNHTNMITTQRSGAATRTLWIAYDSRREYAKYFWIKCK